MKKAKIKAKIVAPVELEMVVSLDDDGEAMIHEATVVSKSVKVRGLLQALEEEDSDYIDELAQEALGWKSEEVDGEDEEEWEYEDD